MKERSELGEKKIARRTILSGTVMLGGGAALSAAVPSFAMMAASAAARLAPERELNPMASSVADATENTMRFTKEFLSNKAFDDLPLSFNPPDSRFMDSKLLETGALTQPNGDILFRIYAPKAKDVTLKFGIDSAGPGGFRGGEIVLTKQDDGTFEGLFPWNENHTGPMNVDVNVDGMTWIYPYMPIQWSLGSPHNFVEAPDLDLEFTHIKNVPHGAITRQVYWTDELKTWERCFTYTPPGYMKSTRDYPVLYLQHGGGENEEVWGFVGKTCNILDNLIAEGKAEPFLVVMNNNHILYDTTPNGTMDLAFERSLIGSCIPFIEKNYRAKTDKWNRAIAGLSMGCMMSCDIAFRHPEVFGNLGTFNASMTHEHFSTTYERPYPKVIKAPEAFAKNYRVYHRSATPNEDHFPYFLADDKICADAGIDKLPSYHRIVYPKRTAKWNSWRMGLRDFAQELFRETESGNRAE